MFDPPLSRDFSGYIDDARTQRISWHRLQGGWYGFRVDGGALNSYPTEEEARAAYWRLGGRYR